MPDAWSKKDERKYQHIKESQEERGSSVSRAEEIAARTVNKQRREQGRTANRTTRGTGNPNKPLEERSKRELYNRAKKLKIQGRSKLTKAELIEAVRNAN